MCPSLLGDARLYAMLLRCDEDLYILHGARSRRASRRDASSRSWTFGQRVAGCSGEDSGGGTVMSPISTASCAAGMRARVAAQYFGASSR